MSTVDAPAADVMKESVMTSDVMNDSFMTSRALSHTGAGTSTWRFA
jgi:hypothetical protein